MNSTSSSLLERVKSRDQAAWERLVSLYSPLVYHWCRQAGLQAADAADVGQEVFQAVARKVADFRHDRPGDSFRRWLRTITRNKLRDRAKRDQVGEVGAGGSDAQNALLQVPADDAEQVSAEQDNHEAALVYRQAVDLVRAEFQGHTWESFWRVTVEDHRPEDVARDLGVTVNVVYLAKSRVLRRLRDEFAGLVEDVLLGEPPAP